MATRSVALNSASEQDLARVGGLGPERVRRIVQSRPFRNWDDVKAVERFSERLVNDLREAGATLGLRRRRGPHRHRRRCFAMNQRPTAQLMLLTTAAGTLDALCYLHAKVFAANMTGNIVLLGLDLIRNEHQRGAWYGLAIAAFAAGVLISGPLLVKLDHAASDELRKGTALELPLVLAFSLLSLAPAGAANPWSRAGLVCAGGAAMGVQSVAVRRLRISGVVTTFITGTLTTAVVNSVFGGEDGARSGNLIAMLLIYVAAAAATALWSWTGLPQFAPLVCVAAAWFGSRG